LKEFGEIERKKHGEMEEHEGGILKKLFQL